ncbi:Cysteine-rich protein 1 [Lamellibrachia satsuma]|nr:Cysteine-rich protein 1 [Lamellibrachia satsuma]
MPVRDGECMPVRDGEGMPVRDGENMPVLDGEGMPVRYGEAERKTSLGKDWHPACLKCTTCNKTLTPGGHSEHKGDPYCNKPCYAAKFGPKGFGHGGTESHIFAK